MYPVAVSQYLAMEALKAKFKVTKITHPRSRIHWYGGERDSKANWKR